MRLRFRALPLAALFSTLTFGCDKASPDTNAPTDQTTTATAQEPAAATAWGDGSLSGTVTLKWGAPAPDGSTLQLRVYMGGTIVHQHDQAVSGSGPWEFQFAVDDTSSFAEGQLFGIGATIVVPPDGASWYRGDPMTVPVWQSGVEQTPVALTISPINPAAAGDGPPK